MKYKVVDEKELPAIVANKGPENEFDPLLKELPFGKGLVITPDDGEKIGSLKMRINNAASRAGKKVEYQDDKHQIYVKVVGSLDEPAPENPNRQN